MVVKALIAGGLEQANVSGVAALLCYSTASSPRDTNAYAPRAGLRGLKMQQGVAAEEMYIPHSDLFAADAARTHMALYFEHTCDRVSRSSADDATTSAGAEWIVIGRLKTNAISREIRLCTRTTTRVAFGVNATTSSDATSWTDTAQDFVAVGVVVGDWVWVNNSRMKVTSISGVNNRKLNGAAWEPVGNPASNQAYNIYSDYHYRYEVWDNAATPLFIMASANFNETTQLGVIHVIELDFAPQAAGAPTTKLSVDGTTQTATTGNGTNTNPASFTWEVFLSSSSGGKTGHYPASFSYFYNFIVWDNTGSNRFSGAWASQYQATVTDRPYVTLLPTANGVGAGQFNSWTKQSGTDPGAMVYAHPSVDFTTYMDGAGINTKQSWKHVAHGLADFPIGDNDVIYAVRPDAAVAWRDSTAGPKSFLLVTICDGTNESSATETVIAETAGSANTPGFNPVAFCVETAPDATGLTPTKLDTIQTCVKQLLTHTTNPPRVFGEGLLVVGKSAPAARKLIVQQAVNRAASF